MPRNGNEGGEGGYTDRETRTRTHTHMRYSHINAGDVHDGKQLIRKEPDARKRTAYSTEGEGVGEWARESMRDGKLRCCAFTLNTDRAPVATCRVEHFSISRFCMAPASGRLSPLRLPYHSCFCRF